MIDGGAASQNEDFDYLSAYQPLHTSQLLNCFPSLRFCSRRACGKTGPRNVKVQLPVVAGMAWETRGVVVDAVTRGGLKLGRGHAEGAGRGFAIGKIQEASHGHDESAD
jgi:hypothetical protein